MASTHLNLLYSNELATRRSWTIAQAKRDCFLDSTRQDIERLGLRMTAAQLRNGGDELSFFVTFDQHSE